MPNSPLSRYNRLIDECQILPDAKQAAAVEALQMQHSALKDAQASNTGLLSRFLSRKVTPAPQAMQGLYLWGGVGRGKSMLMDLLAQSCAPDQVTRQHFHSFMRQVHARIHALRAVNTPDPLARVAEEIANTPLLCFDEMQVHDITDAMILSRLFTLLFSKNVRVIMTSNRPPEDLYLHGLQREQFLPFIQLLRTKMQIFQLDAQQDYRTRNLTQLGDHYRIAPIGSGYALLQPAFAMLCAGESARPLTIQYAGRNLHFSESCRDMILTSFEHLCCCALAAGDYLAIAEHINVLLLYDIPQMSADNRNEAKRFVNLIDVLYEQRAILLCTAEVPPEQLYTGGTGAFEFERTTSRLLEMQTNEYIHNARA